MLLPTEITKNRSEELNDDLQVLIPSSNLSFRFEIIAGLFPFVFERTTI